jgi:uncharacterized CHY-type Zn-finger protein
MSEKKIRVCDRCGDEIKRPPGYTPVHIHDHHIKVVDLCGVCRHALDRFMRREKV